MLFYVDFSLFPLSYFTKSNQKKDKNYFPFLLFTSLPNNLKNHITFSSFFFLLFSFLFVFFFKIKDTSNNLNINCWEINVAITEYFGQKNEGGVISKKSVNIKKQS